MVKKQKQGGFTVLELIIVIVVIAILASLVLVGYNGVQKHAASTATMSALDSARETIDTDIAYDEDHAVPDELPSSLPNPQDVVLTYKKTGGGKYTGLTAVQNGVLFHDICVELIADPYYSVIHAREGGGSSSVMMSCDNDVGYNRILVTGWESEKTKWYTPVKKETIQAYIDSVAYDNWWTDRQEVVRGFFTELINRFESRGGTWPITSFYDGTSDGSWGVKRQELPVLDMSAPAGYCLQAKSTKYDSVVYKVTNTNSRPEEGVC